MIKKFTFKKIARTALLLLFLQSVFVLHSCGKPEVIPAYIHIDSVNLKTTANVDGTNSHNIPDAWVYVDNQLVGDFELPATIPIPANGTHVVQVAPGIRENGATAEREPYPFYTLWSQTMNLVPKTVTVVKPVSNYTSYSHPFDWSENFELAGLSLVDTVGTDTTIRRDTLKPFEGRVSGSVYLDGKPGKVAGSHHYTFFCQSATSFPRPVGSPVYMEINYKCNNKFSVGLINVSDNNSISYVFFNPNPTWKKMYVRLTDVLNDERSTC
jgi:hypothetical protein